ncbi:uncharacterized protein NECHADRAFT_81082 [Fusarium vanettenii 77-13-4]|uniref:UvrD-like helicase C-terminal domain-containing protein n=1 Tax=Fusarium vanettenii (strain ATCC MYA-4622 / CBS 123669 / FGSC 9596 / NRRL 45880 / 77-13-4) TaxID=660122 RepID=C7ZGG6_FUSV7|nr:uncharacterized protein NECHADRAFT_81082 [Fusarium vanettenii 77-13-4]EEU36932.1 hypothetical protein NECHADRAFT_81082 [Fusarium vanettenii 77-13-4]
MAQVRAKMLGQIFLAWRPAARARLKEYTAEVLAPGIRGQFRSFAYTSILLRQHRKNLPFAPSEKQHRIAKLCRTKNVVVSARPGSGKTATVEAIIAANPDKRICALAFSRSLQQETSQRLGPYPNCRVITFHAAAGELFGIVVSDDAILSKQIERAVVCNKLPEWNPEPFDIIVLDEFQDCDESLFWLVNSFILANEKKLGDQAPCLVILGDERQSIFGFRGADERYLTLAPKLLGPISPRPFIEAPLDQSFRLSKQTVHFINKTFLGGEQYITSDKFGPNPIVLKCDPSDSNSLAEKLFKLIEHYGAENTAILAPSVRKRGPFQKTANVLCEDYKVPIAEPNDHECKKRDKVMKGKLCISNIHQFKGSERDLVILFGADSSYFEYFGRHQPQDKCPNEIFVALTRAKKQLVLVYDVKQKPMPFVSVKSLYETANVINMSGNQDAIPPPDAPGQPLQPGLCLPTSVAVRDMVRHMEGESLEEIIKRNLCIQKLPALPEYKHINLSDIVLTDKKRGFYEAVSDLNGLALVAAFEHHVCGTLNTLAVDRNEMERMPPVCSKKGVSWLCRQACYYRAKVSGYRARKIQMKTHKFNWIKPEDIARARSRLERELKGSATSLRFEVDAEKHISIGEQKCRISGRADMVVTFSGSESNKKDVVWEMKFVSQLSNQDVIQAWMYAYLLRLSRATLYNVRTGEK